MTRITILFRLLQRIGMSRRGVMTLSARSAKDRKSTRLNSSHTVIYTLSLHDALPILIRPALYDAHHDIIPIVAADRNVPTRRYDVVGPVCERSEEHTSELQSHSDLHSFPTRRSSDLDPPGSL